MQVQMEHQQMVERRAVAVVQVQLVRVRMVELDPTVFRHGHQQHLLAIPAITRAVEAPEVMEQEQRLPLAQVAQAAAVQAVVEITAVSMEQ
jgi:hypothetical protein